MIIEPRINQSGVFSIDIVMIGHFSKPINLRSGTEFPFNKNIVSANEETFTAFIPSVNLRNFVVCVEVKHMDEKLISKDKTGHIIWRSNQKI